MEVFCFVAHEITASGTLVKYPVIADMWRLRTSPVVNYSVSLRLLGRKC